MEMFDADFVYFGQTLAALLHLSGKIIAAQRLL